jgi:hypothetical protein
MKQCQDCGTIVPNFWRRILGKGYCKNCANKHIKPKSLPKISKKKAIENQEYSILRVEFLNKHPTCQAKLPGCTVMSTDVHHMKGRGKYTLDVSTWFALCRACHVYIEMNSDVAKEYGFTKTRI